jgi:hypothetical protein
MIGICANGHMTGSRRCGQCGADRKRRMEPGDGKVLLAKHQLPRGPHGEEDWLRQLRRETQVGSGPLGPNKIGNISYPASGAGS